MDFVIDYFLPALAVVLLEIAIEYACQRIYIPIPEPRWCFDDLKEREKVNARKMVSFSPWIKTKLSICVGIVSVDMLIIRLFPVLFWDMGMSPNVILTVLGIPMLFALCVMLWMFRWIHYDNETFTYRNAFGIKKTYRYEAVATMTIQKQKLTVVADGRKMVFPITFYGAREFVSFAVDRIKK